MPSAPPAARRSGFARLLTFLGWLALTVFYFSPVTTVMDTLLDSSNYSSYTYFAAHRFQYGPEVVPMSGPYGYVMYGSVYNGLLFWTRLGAQLVCVGALSALVLWFFGQARASAWRWFWLPLIVLLSPIIEDLPFEWMILLTGLFLLQRPPAAPGPRWLVPAAALLAFISLIKGTHFVLSGATLALVFAGHAWFRDWRRLALIAGSYAAAFLLFWLLAGQEPGHIPAFIQGIRALTDGYNEAMALDETRGALLRGLLAASLLAAAYAWGLWHRRQNPVVFVSALLFAGFTFVKWKHGFVRADGHMNIFHHYAMVAAVFWFLLVFAVHRAEEPRRVRWVATGLMLAGFGAGFWIESGRVSVLRMRWLLTTWNVEHLQASLDQLLHPAGAKARFDRQLAEQREILAMPLTRQEAGDRPIDLFGVQHGIIPLNGMNYRPRPMGGGAFNAYNPYLMRLNREFIRDPARRPAYYLLRFETIDRRLAAEDDGLTLLEILHHYRPLFIEREHLLLKAVDRPTAAAPQFLSRRQFKFSEFVPTPRVADDQLLLARFTIEPSLKGRLRSFLYKAPLMFMTLQGDGITDPESRRFIPAMTSTPFLFSPAIEENTDVAYLYTRQPGKRVTGFFIYSHDPACYNGDLTVEFFTLPRPPVPQSPDIDELLTFTRFPIFNLTPESIQAAESHAMHLRGLLVQTLHAPGEVVWKLDGTEQELVFDYGFLPEAVMRGNSNGAIFLVEVRPPTGAPQEIFRRLVDPAQRTEDRGNLSARVALPPLQPGSRLVLRTDPGEGGNNAWDWCYVTRVQLKRGYFSSPRFPVFNREPASVVPADAGPLDLEQDKVFLLHLPGTLTFNLRGDEHRVRLEFGFMPGAYTGEGRTEGGDFVVELLQPGQPARELFRRSLRPVGVAADRGRQSAEVKLPALAAGDQLLVRTLALPGAGNSWGWTYFSRLTID